GMVDRSSAREASRARRKQAARDKKILPSQTDDYGRSGRATHVCWQDWLQHAAMPEMRSRAAAMREGADANAGPDDSCGTRKLHRRKTRRDQTGVPAIEPTLVDARGWRELH